MASPPELDELYDDDTIAALDRAGHPAPHPRAGGVRGQAAAGALVAALALGMQEAFEPRRSEEVVVEVDATDLSDADQPVRLVYVPHAPKATRAFVRPWLFGSPV